MQRKTSLVLLQIDNTGQDRHKYYALCWPLLSTTPTLYTVDHVLSAHVHNYNSGYIMQIGKMQMQYMVRGVCALQGSSLRFATFS